MWFITFALQWSFRFVMRSLLAATLIFVAIEAPAKAQMTAPAIPPTQ
jgi:hypothetical protein